MLLWELNFLKYALHLIAKTGLIFKEVSLIQALNLISYTYNVTVKATQKFFHSLLLPYLSKTASH